MEACPAVVRAEVRRAVVTIGIGGVVAVVIIIGFAREERSHRCAAEARAEVFVHLLHQRRVLHVVARQVLAGDALVLPVRLPALLTQHGGEAVLADVASIGEVVLQLPVFIVVALPVILVAGLLPTAQVDRGLPCLGVAVADVVAQLSVPHQVLQEAHLGEDIAGQLAALQGVFVHVGQCHGVGVGISLAHLGVVVAEDVVDGDVGQCGQRVADDTLRTVGTLQLVIGSREGARHAELQPGLQLCVKVSTHGVAAEFRADDRTLLIHEVARDVVFHGIVAALCAQLVLVL